MEILISYFYQIRNFSRNMIPVSTACGDPAWYHHSTGNKEVQGFDKRGVWLGIRYPDLSPQYLPCACPCEYHKKGKENCDFLFSYKAYLGSLDFNKMLKDFEKLSNWGISALKIKNPVIVLIVHEAFTNPCSERIKIKEWFQENGYDLKEFKASK